MRLKASAIKLTILLLLAASSNATAEKAILYTGSPVVIKVAHLNPTEIKFEGDSIASIVMGIPPDTISLQNTPDTLFIQPLSDTLSGDIYVIMRDGKSKIITLTSTLPNMRDRAVRIINGVEQVTQRIDKLNRTGITPAGLIKAMVTGEDMDGVAISQTKQTILEVPVMLVANTVYDAVFYKGFIVDIQGMHIDIKQISMKGLVAGALHNDKAYFVVMQ